MIAECLKCGLKLSLGPMESANVNGVRWLRAKLTGQKTYATVTGVSFNGRRALLCQHNQPGRLRQSKYEIKPCSNTAVLAT